VKRCAKCDREYADQYDACPRCARAGSRFFRYYLRFNQIGIALLVLLIVGFTLWFSMR
jgi:hypothetical protein